MCNVQANVAVFQGLPEKGNVSENLVKVRKACELAQQSKVDLILFAELFLCGYDIGVENLRANAVSINSHDIQQIKEVAVKYNMAVSIGYSEFCQEDNKVYNSCCLISDKGEVMLNYRKTHLWDPDVSFEKVAFSSGNELPVCDLVISRTNEIIRIGILICFDVEFPEPARILSLNGAQIILVPTAICGSGINDFVPNKTVPTRAFENHTFILYSNLIGSCSIFKSPAIFCGQSAILAPDGSELARAGGTEENILMASLSGEQYRAHVYRNTYFADRKPALYDKYKM